MPFSRYFERSRMFSFFRSLFGACPPPRPPRSPPPPPLPRPSPRPRPPPLNWPRSAMVSMVLIRLACKVVRARDVVAAAQSLCGMGGRSTARRQAHSARGCVKKVVVATCTGTSMFHDCCPPVKPARGHLNQPAADTFTLSSRVPSPPCQRPAGSATLSAPSSTSPPHELTGACDGTTSVSLQVDRPGWRARAGGGRNRHSLEQSRMHRLMPRGRRYAA